MARVVVGNDNINTYFFEVASMGEDAEVTPNIEGFYISTKEIPSKQNPNQMVQIHKIKTKKGFEHVFWGTKVLDDKIAHFQPGQYIYIDYLGKSAPKKKGANGYHNYEVAFDDAIKPVAVASEEVDVAAEVAAPAKTAKKAPKVEEDVDDLPF